MSLKKAYFSWKIRLFYRKYAKFIKREELGFCLGVLITSNYPPAVHKLFISYPKAYSLAIQKLRRARHDTTQNDGHDTNRRETTEGGGGG